MKPFKPVKTAVIGCGVISDIYLTNFTKRFNAIEVVGCSDLKPERSQAKAEKYGIKQMTNEEIFNNPEIELVINLTYHTSHYEVTKQSLLAGKHVYSEKMMAVDLWEGEDLLKTARETGLYCCGAPDTYLGAGLQTARGIYDSGLLGKVIAANVTLARGYRHNRWREDPERRFAFCPGGGIIFDVGCYYLMALINIIGPVKRVCGFSQILDPENRIYMNPKNPNYGKVMKVETVNNIAGTLEFESGAICSLLNTTESINFNNFMLFGTEGQMSLGDPNNFGDIPVVSTKLSSNIQMPLTHAYNDNSRGLGAIDLAYSIRNGRSPRNSSERIYHMFEIAHGIINSGETGEIYTMQSTCTRAEPFAPGYSEYPEMVMDI